MDGLAALDTVSGVDRVVDVCVVVPMFNEASVIEDVLQELLSEFEQVVCVDDGSTDGSGRLASAAGAKVIKHNTNLGQGAALQTGIEYALDATGAGFIVTFDADGQHLVSDAREMVRLAQRESLDLVLGSRFLAGAAGVPRGRRLLLRAAVIMTRLTTGLHLTDSHNGLRVLSRTAAQALDIRLAGMAHASEILASITKHGWRFREYPVSILYTDYSVSKGQSSINAVNVVFDLVMARARVSP